MSLEVQVDEVHVVFSAVDPVSRDFEVGNSVASLKIKDGHYLCPELRTKSLTARSWTSQVWVILM